MTALYRLLVILLAGSLLASCGGGGGGDSGGGGGFTPQQINVTVTPASTTSTPFSLVGVTVRVTGNNGAPLSDGTVVQLQVSPPGVGLVSSVQATGTTVPPNAGGNALVSESVTATLSGGVANFRLHTRAVGTATLTASVTDPAAPARVVRNTAGVSVQSGAGTDPRLTLSVNATTIPVNPGVAPFFGSPYIVEIVGTWRNLDGTLVTPRTDEDACGVTVTGGGTGIGAFSTLDSPDTPVNDFEVLLGQGPVEVVAGRCLIFLHSFPTFTSGTGQVTVSVVDQITGETISQVVNFTQSNGSAGLPGAIVIAADDSPVYIQGVNGAQSKPFSVFLYDGGGTLVPNGSGTANNVRLEIVGGAQGGERLQAGAASGAVVTTRTLNGVANAIYQSGTRTGQVTIRATGDRSDNNVDNGIQDPITSTRTITVSDGRLFDLDITSPFVNAIVVNPGLQEGEEGLEIDLPIGTIIVPPVPDATYSLTVAVIATDRFGNPVPAGTEIRFGLIDHPQQNGTFQIAGNDGNPQEGGTLFTAPTGAFTTAGGGAGPGDTLIVFGEESTGNRDLESARTVQSINGPTSLNVTYRFNHNDDTGAIRDNGPVLPYVIGRATDGNVTVTAQTNALGVAVARMTYPTSKLGKLVILWAQGAGDIVNGNPEQVTDAEFLRFAGLFPAILTANPSVINGNRTVPVRVCLTDLLGNPLQGSAVSFAFNNLGNATGNVNGISSGGTLSETTGANGCLTANVTTTGMTSGNQSGTNAPNVIFTSAGASATVTITPPQFSILQASPTSHIGDSPVQITLTLLDGSGAPINGTFLFATCTTTGGMNASLQVFDPPGATGETGPGQTTTIIDPNGFQTINATPPTGTCTFAPASGSPSVTVTFRGVDVCSFDPDFSPTCPAQP